MPAYWHEDAQRNNGSDSAYYGALSQEAALTRLILTVPFGCRVLSSGS